MRQNLVQNLNSSFKIQFSAGKSIFSNLSFSKTGSSLNISSNVRPTDDDIYYDEVVYYDGGGVEGYGD